MKTSCFTAICHQCFSNLCNYLFHTWHLLERCFIHFYILIFFVNLEESINYEWFTATVWVIFNPSYYTTLPIAAIIMKWQVKYCLTSCLLKQLHHNRVLFVLNDYGYMKHVCAFFYDCLFSYDRASGVKNMRDKEHFLKNRYYLKNCNICVLLLHSVWSVVEVILIL